MDASAMLAARAEWIEGDALASSALAAPPAVAVRLGLALLADRGAVASLCSAVDALALNRVVGLGVHAPASEEQLDRVLAFARASGVRRLHVQLPPGATPAPLARWIEERGGRPHNRWVRVWRRPEESLPEVTTSLAVERVDAGRGEAFARVLRSAFGMPESVEPWLAAMVGRPGWRHYAALDRGEVVATAALFAADGLAWLGLAATLASHRGRGAQSALIARRLREAAAAGCEWAVAETAEDLPDRPAPSLRNMRRLGFAEAYRRQNYLFALAGPEGDGAAT